MKFRLLRILSYALRKLRLPNDAESIALSTERIRESASISGVNLWVLLIAVFIACLGLNIDSVTVVIGAMLISPLMGPISAIGLGLGINDWNLVKQAGKNMLLAALLSLCTSTIFFSISPMKDAGEMLLNHTSPSLFDVLIALFGGLAHVMASSSKLRSANAIAGVAIATTLMMPLCTTGYAISVGEIRYVAGAMYLFFINSVFIAAATFFMVNIFRYPKVSFATASLKKQTRNIISTILIVTFVPSIYLTYHIVNRYFFEQRANRFIKEQVQDNNHFVITKRLIYSRNKPRIELSMLGQNIDSSRYLKLCSKMEKYNLKNVGLVFYQGEDTKSATKDYFDQVSTNLETNKATVKMMATQLDSLQKLEMARLAVDTMEIHFANLIAADSLPLKSVKIKPEISYNVLNQSKDTLWLAQITVDGNPNNNQRKIIEERLKEALKTEQFNLELK